LGWEFGLLEAGYMGQLLMQEAPEYRLGLCPIGLLEFAPIKTLLGLSETHLLAHSFLGGAIEPAQTQTWLQPTTQQQSPAELKAEWQNYLQEKLPTHMVPEQFVILEQLPLTPNGKVDRQALPQPAALSLENVILPQTELEQALAEIIKQVLQIQTIGLHTPFFELGANSLKMLQIQNKIHLDLGVEISIVDLFKYPTLHQLAGFLSQTTVLPQSDPTISQMAHKRKAFLQQRRQKHES